MVIGNIVMYAGSTPPEKFLECDGRAISRTTYADLFGVIGTTFGVGDGSSTFNLPNMTGRVAVGANSDYSFGSSGGEETVTLIESELPSHTHEVPVHGHENTISAATPSLSHNVTTQPAFNYSSPNGTASIQNSGDGSGSRSGTSTGTASISTNCSISDHPATDCTMTGGVTDCPAFDTESEGGNESHNNMQPYMTMLYIIYAGV